MNRWPMSICTNRYSSIPNTGSAMMSTIHVIFGMGLPGRLTSHKIQSTASTRPAT